MTRNDFIHVLSDAIQMHEGYTDTSLSYKNFNAGNLKFAHQQFATEADNGFAVFGNFYNGKQSQLNDLNAKLDSGLVTIYDIINTYAPPSENDTDAYISDVVAFFNARNIPINSSTNIPAYLAGKAGSVPPVVFVAVNQLYAPKDWASIQSSIVQCARYMTGYAFSCRYSNADLSKDIIQVTQQIAPGGTFSGVSAAASRQALAAYNEGQLLNVLIYSGAIMQGAPEPWGGCEYQGVTEPEAKISAVSSVMYQGPVFEDPTARILFHELIHELFSLTEQTDKLHAYLLAHGGYPENLAIDLEAVFTGNDLNTPEALSNLEAEKRSL